MSGNCLVVIRMRELQFDVCLVKTIFCQNRTRQSPLAMTRHFAFSAKLTISLVQMIGHAKGAFGERS
jgi:hypothetical protein